MKSTKASRAPALRALAICLCALAAQAAAGQAAAKPSLPIAAKTTTFKAWWNYGLQQYWPTLSTTEGNIEMERRTNIHLDRIEPPTGQRGSSSPCSIRVGVLILPAEYSGDSRTCICGSSQGRRP